MKKGDIALVLFPFTNLVASKLRPALILGTVNSGRDYIVCGITSVKSGKFVKISSLDLSFGDLPKISYIKYEKIVTLDKNIFKSVVATVKPKKYKEVINNIREIVS